MGLNVRIKTFWYTNYIFFYLNISQGRFVVRSLEKDLNYIDFF